MGHHCLTRLDEVAQIYFSEYRTGSSGSCRYPDIVHNDNQDLGDTATTRATWRDPETSAGRYTNSPPDMATWNP